MYFILQKKQAVRRLSQGTAGQGHRWEDIRRKLEAKRCLAASGQEGNERKFPRGNVRQGGLRIVGKIL